MPPIPVPLRSGLKNNFFKEKKKNPPPHRGHPSPTCMGGRGAQHVLDSWKHQAQKKRLVWSSASWSGFPRLPLPPSTVAPSASLVERAPLLCRQLSSAKAPDGRVQAGVGGKVVGKGTEVPEAPAPAAGRVRAAWSSLDRPCVCLSLSALLPREVHARCHLDCVCGREGLRRWRAGRRAAGLPSPRGEEVQNAGTKKANTTGSQITRPSLPEFP